MSRNQRALARTGFTMQRNIDLRKIREGLGLTLQYVAALAGTTDMTLQRCEDRMEDDEMVDDIMAVLALYMATRWGADILHLTEDNLRDTK